MFRHLAVVLALLAPSVVRAQSPEPPARVWTQLVDLYLEGRPAEAATAVLALEPDEITSAARSAFEAWKRDARAAQSDLQLAPQRRRLQASALLPLEMLLAIRMPVAPSRRVIALEQVSRDAWEHLEAHEQTRGGVADAAAALRIATFRRWWRIGLLQCLVATARYEEFRRQSDVFGTPNDAHAAAEHHFLRGVSAETQARLAEEASVGSGSRAEAAKARAPFIAEALGEARREYGRALAFSPAHAEATLRLARVDFETGRPDPARQALARLATEPCADDTCALAWLFLAQAHDKAGSPSARAAYAVAAQVPFVSRAARLGLVSLRMREGDEADALLLTDAFMGRPSDTAAPAPGQDGWALYLSGQRLDPDLPVRRMKAVLEP